jgi:RecB family exonuclease
VIECTAFQQRILDWAENSGGTVIVPNRRLATVLRHLYRMRKQRSGARGWTGPEIATLGGFINKSWRRSWPPVSLADRFARWQLWFALQEDDRAPGGIAPSISLSRQLDESYAVLVRHRLDPAAGDRHSPLSAWRARVCRRFDKELQAQQRQMHPARQLDYLAAWTRSEQRLRREPPLLLAGFGAPSPAEGELFRALSERHRLEQLALPTEDQQAFYRATVLPDRDQELGWLGEALVRCASEVTPLSQIGIVLCDITRYQDPIERMLRDVLGDNDWENGTGYYNLALAHSLADKALCRAALLPLQLAMGVSRLLLNELFLSPYVPCFQPWRLLLAQADRIWRRDNLEHGSLSTFERILAEKASPSLRDLVHQPERRLSTLLAPLIRDATQSHGHQRTLAEWTSDLQAVWHNLRMAEQVGPRESAQRQQIASTVEQIRTQANLTDLPATDAYSWITGLLAEQVVGSTGSELAGVQVVGLSDSRGLALERIFVPGLTAAAFPSPVRRFPLLNASEQSVILGGSARSQYQFAQRSMRELLASGAQVIVSRPEFEDREPLPPSPFWPNEGEDRRSFTQWQEPSPIWLRAPWLSSAWQGMLSPAPQAVDAPRPCRLPPSLSASRVQLLSSCPLRFCVEALLGLAPLEECRRGIDAAAKGNLLHNLLRAFVNMLLDRGISVAADRALAEQSLLRCVDALAEQSLSRCVDALAEQQIDPLSWRVERERLVGRPGAPLAGLMGRWLEHQADQESAGWRPWKTETAFAQVRLPAVSFTINGRIDRIDLHPEHGVVVWDYKSGDVPSESEIAEHYTQPQLLIYLAALYAKRIPGQEQLGAPNSIAAGYWQLKSERAQGPKFREKSSAFWREAYDRFIMHVQKIASAAELGDFPPRPRILVQRDLSAKVCSTCAANCFCALQTASRPPSGLEQTEQEPEETDQDLEETN